MFAPLFDPIYLIAKCHSNSMEALNTLYRNGIISQQQYNEFYDKITKSTDYEMEQIHKEKQCQKKNS